MNVFLMTSAARGHAIAEALARSSHRPNIIAVSPHNNPGIESLATVQQEMDLSNFDLALETAKKHKCDWAIIGPEDPIGAGIADELEAVGIPTVAPTKSLARVEASKGFTRELLAEYDIDASPKFAVFTRDNAKLMEKYMADELEGNFVVKYDALKGGKGVKVSGEHLHSIQEGVQYAEECINECGRVLIEEKLIGVEFSLISFVSGKQVVDMPIIQDHKRAFAGDTGPNTGGMGTYSAADHSLPFLSTADVERAKEINRLTAEALLNKCGHPFKGFLYGGFIAVKGGVRLIEYNARLGDPEALNILPLLQTDFVDVCQGIINGELTDDLVSFAPKATVCKYITPAGYPENKEQKGEPVTFPEMTENARLYYGDVTRDADGSLQLGGSRTAGIVGIADSISEAEAIAENLCQQVKGPVRWRSDIGTDAVIQQRIDMMKKLRD